MKIKSFVVVLALFFTLFSVFSCKKANTEGPIVNITTPLIDDQFSNDQDIRIKGDVSDVVDLHALTIKITDDKTGAVFFTTSPTVHGVKTFNYDVVWKVKVTDWIDATITIVAENANKVQTTKMQKTKIWL
jgi:hypothetical protein